MSAASRSASPAAPAVSRSIASAPASHTPSATKMMSCAAISAASSCAARASAMRPSGSSSDQFAIGPSGLEYRPRSGMAPYCTGTVSACCAFLQVCRSNGRTVFTALNE